MINACLLLRYPLEIILRFEYQFCGVSFLLNTLNGKKSALLMVSNFLITVVSFLAILLFLSICIFGACCWQRDWLLYPNFNYVSWSFAFAVFATLIHIGAALLMFKVCPKKNGNVKNLIVKIFILGC